jgi:hypothetical protein
MILTLESHAPVFAPTLRVAVEQGPSYAEGADPAAVLARGDRLIDALEAAHARYENAIDARGEWVIWVYPYTPRVRNAVLAWIDAEPVG